MEKMENFITKKKTKGKKDQKTQKFMEFGMMNHHQAKMTI